MTELHVTNAIGKFVLPPAGSGLCWRTLSQNGVWERETIDFISRNVKGNSIITAGTYVGDFLPGFNKNARWVYGFEPDLSSFEFCLKNIALNEITNASCENLALSSESGEASLVTSGAANAWAGDYQPGEFMMGEKSFLAHGSNEAGARVKTVSIDEFVSQRRIADLRIIHLDVEGHERNALLGAVKSIEQFDPIVIVEEGSTVTDILPSRYKLASFTVGHDHVENGNTRRFQNMIYSSDRYGGLL